MDLWSRIAGTVTVELTSAEPERILGDIAHNNIEVWDVQRSSSLIMIFRIERRAFVKVQEIVTRAGGTLKKLGLHGVYYRVVLWRKRPVVLGVALLLLLASVYVPGRILFVQVVGNDSVPSRLIMETAAQFGLEFGASRRQVRSERIKNELLGAIEELEWVGVNTSGCTATITVRERKLQPEEAQGKICNVVAAADGIIDSITLTRGMLLCKPGQAVRAGQLLVSGYSDLGICTRAMEAEAEIYALTRHEQRAVLPADTLLRQQQEETKVRYSIVIGKKRINLYSDSGILPSTCGKMTQVIWLRLPGGQTLPAALVIQKFTRYQTQQLNRQEEQVSTMLEDAAERHLLETAVAGQILTQRSQLQLQGNRYEFIGSYECREMIARQDDGVYLEGDTNDDPEDSKRGES